MRGFIIKQIYLALLVVIFCLPLAQMKFNLFKEEPLHGFEEKVSLPKITIAGLMDRSHQKGVEKWFSRKFGLRAFYVRCNNQIYYSLFGQTPSDSTIEIGKNRQFLEKIYINYFLSVLPQSGREEISAYAAEVRKAQKLLVERGITLILLISPSKAAFLPETIPRYYHTHKRKHSTVYEEMVKALDEEGVEYINGRKILRDAKQAENESMFPRGGTHWNRLGAYYVTREILRNVQARSKKQMVPIKVEERLMKEWPKGSDRDLARLVNLLWTPDRYTVPVLSYEQPENPDYFRPKVLFSGGSFNWLLIDVLKKMDYFHTIDFYYYYSTHWHYDRHGEQEKIGKIDLENWPVKAADADVIILEMNESIITGMEFIRDLINTLE